MKRITFEGYDWIMVPLPENSFGYEIVENGVEYSYFEKGVSIPKKTTMGIEDVKEGNFCGDVRVIQNSEQGLKINNRYQLLRNMGS